MNKNTQKAIKRRFSTISGGFSEDEFTIGRSHYEFKSIDRGQSYNLFEKVDHTDFLVATVEGTQGNYRLIIREQKWILSRCDHKALKDNVLDNPSKENLEKLGEWFELFGGDYWNGECYNADDFRLFPIYKKIEEDEWERTGWEIRY